MKIYNNLNECKNLSVIKMARTDDKRFLGIRMPDGVIFFNTGLETFKDKTVYHTIEIIDNWHDVPKELLEQLNLKIDLVPTDEQNPFGPTIREK